MMVELAEHSTLRLSPMCKVKIVRVVWYAVRI
jgi:hypothetical protein